MPETIGEAFVSIRGDTTKFEKDAQSLGGTLNKFAKGAGTAVAAVGIGAFFKSAIGEAEEAAKVSAQTAAVIKSTGGAANVSAKQVDDLASSLSELTGIDDEVIASGENVLLTFTNIKNEAGKGNDVFDQATKAALDLSVAMGSDLQGATVQLGKALNDPIAGVTALTKVGVTFTQQQKDQIKALVESGDVLKAQKIILAEVTKEFGGSAEAQATGLDKARVAIGNFQEQIGTALAPAIEAGTEALTGLLEVTDEVGLSTVVTSTALGAMIGLRFGGAQGAAIGAVTGALAGLAAELFETVDAAQAVSAETDKFVQSLKGVSTAQAAAKFDELSKRVAVFNKILGETSGTQKLFRDLAIADPASAQLVINGMKERGDSTKKYETILGGAIAREREHAAAGKQVADTYQTTEEKVKAFITTLEKEKQAVESVQNALLAAQGGILGYQAAVNSTEDAQTAYNDAVAEFGPNSEQAQRAQLALEEAQLRVASAAESVIKEQGDLNDMLHAPTVSALETAKQKLVDFKNQYGDTTGAVQAQIDKTQEAINKWHELHDIENISKTVDFTFTINGQPVTASAAELETFVGGIGSFQTGGIVPGPIGAPQLAVVHGGETITPPGQASPGTTNVWNITTTGEDPLALALGLARRQMVAMLVT